MLGDIFKDMAFDIDGKRLGIGDSVVWFDPDEDARDLERIWVVDDIKGSIVLISDDYSEAEVYPHELKRV